MGLLLGIHRIVKQYIEANPPPRFPPALPHPPIPPVLPATVPTAAPDDVWERWLAEWQRQQRDYGQLCATWEAAVRETTAQLKAYRK